KLMQVLKQRGIKAELRICSAHRTAKMLEKIVSSSNAKIIVAGAGLSAALPGVIASQTAKPVIGIPIENNYSGIDALLSVHQMPPGIVVCGTGINAAEEAAEIAALALKKHDSVRLIKNFKAEKFEKKFLEMQELLLKLGAKFEVSDGTGKIGENEIAVNFVDLNSGDSALSGRLAINVPLLEKDSASDIQKLLEKTKKGLWVGLNRFENAAIASAQLLSVHNEKIPKKVLEHRKSGAEKVIASDSEQSKKWGLV
ncbi:MAG: 5-(carboxyamino)imidazole ribonucleotide mutase, partial [Candidatus ainarchaeum sp.]|nr:5-(carboxyamino)imidazole ribonucleotide mutase [Candidatus ainarchaeum sp.]